MRLKKLEAELGVNLVIRNSRHTRFTGEGERLVLEAQTLIARVDALPGIMRADSGVLTGSLRIVAPFGFGRAFVAPIIAQFSRSIRSCTWIWRCRKPVAGDPGRRRRHSHRRTPRFIVGRASDRPKRTLGLRRPEISRRQGPADRSQAVAATRLPQRSGE